MSSTASTATTGPVSDSFSVVDYFKLTHPLDEAGEGRTVLVTGATGYIAGHIIQILLARGYRVRGTVRDLKKTEDVQHLHKLAEKVHAQYSLELVEADLLKDAGWKEAIDGCEFVLHTASPFVLETNDEASLIKPAVNGTLSVLRGCAQSSSVRRVVVTSSVAAIQHTGNHSKEQKYDEKDWSDEKISPAYPKSKTLAEKEAWRFYRKLHGIRIPEENQKNVEQHIITENKTQEGKTEDKKEEKKEEKAISADYKWVADEWNDSYANKFELCTINPSFVQGPVINTKGFQSQTLVKRFLVNDMPGIPHFGFSVVDVRDVALAHIRAMTAPKESVDGQRFILSADFLWMEWVAQWLADEFEANGYSIRQLPAPFLLLKVVALFDIEARHLLDDIGVVIRFDNNKSKTVLGIQYISTKQSLIDMAYSLIEYGVVPDKRKRHPLDKEKIVKWQADNSSKTCPKCSKPFTFIRRHHHCYCCGSLFCDVCTDKKVNNKRACHACAEKYHTDNPVNVPVAAPVVRATAAAEKKE